MWTNAWLVLYTWLQHNDPSVPQYGEDEWTWVKGALSTIDRALIDAGANVGQGVRWSPDRQQAWEMRDGFTEVRSISQEETAQIVARIGLPMPDP